MPGNYLRHLGLITPTCLTGAAAAGDLIIDTTAIPNACSAIDQPTYLVKAVVYEPNGSVAVGDLRILFLAGSTSLGTVDAAPSIDNDAEFEVIGDVLIPAADWHDVGNSKWVEISKDLLPEAMHPKPGTNTLYFGVVAVGAATYSAGLKFRFYAQDVFPY